MKTLTTKLVMMVFIIGMIGISSCTEQEVTTVKDQDAQVELRSSTPCLGDGPQNSGHTVTILSSTTSNGLCCVTVSITGTIESGWQLRAAQSFQDANGDLYYASPCNALTLTPSEYEECIRMPVTTQANKEMYEFQSEYELCFEYQEGTKFLHISIVDGNGQLVHCSYFPNPCI